MRAVLHHRMLAIAVVLTAAVSSHAVPARIPIAGSSDTIARERIEAALLALGGRSRIEEPAYWFVEGRGRENLSAELQGEAPDRPTWRPHEEKVAVDTRSLTVAWERRTPRNDLSLRWRKMIFGRERSGFVDWNGPRAVLRDTGTPEPRRRALARRIPHLLLLEVATGASSARVVAENSRHSKNLTQVEVELPGAGRLILGIGREPALLHSVEYFAYLPGRGNVTVVWEWFGWRPDSSLGAVPAGHRIRIGGDLYQEVRYSEFGNGALATATLLSIPKRLLESAPAMSAADIRPLAGETPLEASGEVAPGVHVAEVGGFFVMFVEFRDFVVAVEAPESHPGFESIPAEAVAPSVTASFVELIRKTVPGKPVRYAVISHHHSDHIGGVRAMADAGATVLVAPTHANVARAALGRLPVEVVARRRVLTDGERSMEILNVGPNPHTAENLCVWFPKERILFQGDLFYYVEGAPFPPSGRETMNRFFAAWLSARGIKPVAIYGVHGAGAAGPERLSESMPKPAP